MTPMLHFRHPDETPPGGKFFFQDELLKDKLFKAGDFRSLMDMIGRTRRANKIEIPADFEEQVMHWMCLRLPDGWCVTEHGKASVTNKTRTIALCIQRCNRLVLDYPVTFVPTKLATERAEICSTCPNNLPAQGCMPCQGADVMVNSLKRGRSTIYDAELYACKLTHVFNEVQVLATLASITKHDARYRPRGKFPKECWKVKEAENGRGGHDDR